MRFRNLFGDERENEQQPREAASTAPPGADLPALRQAADRFLAAGDEAISRALSSDSERFLAANRQQGGQ
jgi:hypothetical protein